MSKLIYLDNAATTQVYPEVYRRCFHIFQKYTAIHLQFTVLHLRAKKRLIKQELPWQN